MQQWLSLWPGIIMVDLARTEVQMLTEIELNGRANPGRPSARDRSWSLTGRTPDDLLPILRQAISEHYAHLPRAHVYGDLIDLIKHGLGNAYKRGNERDPGKLLYVTAVMTAVGAVIGIRDQGQGFDVARVVDQSDRQERYFVHRGAGFSHFKKTTSVISYADGGRTLLIRFLCDVKDITLSEESGIGTNAKGAKNRCWIDFTYLRPRDQVKVTGFMRADGGFTAMKVSLKPVEELAVIQAQLRHVAVNGGVSIRVLNANFTLPDSTQIVGGGPGPLDFGALRAGQIVELTGRYSIDEGFSPVKLQIRNGSSPDGAVLKGRIEEINTADGTFRVLGMTIATDSQTKLFDKR